MFQQLDHRRAFRQQLSSRSTHFVLLVGLIFGSAACHFDRPTEPQQAVATSPFASQSADPSQFSRPTTHPARSEVNTCFVIGARNLAKEAGYNVDTVRITGVSANIAPGAKPLRWWYKEHNPETRQRIKTVNCVLAPGETVLRRAFAVLAKDGAYSEFEEFRTRRRGGGTAVEEFSPEESEGFPTSEGEYPIEEVGSEFAEWSSSSEVSAPSAISTPSSAAGLGGYCMWLESTEGDFYCSDTGIWCDNISPGCWQCDNGCTLTVGEENVSLEWLGTILEEECDCEDGYIHNGIECVPDNGGGGPGGGPPGGGGGPSGTIYDDCMADETDEEITTMDSTWTRTDASTAPPGGWVVCQGSGAKACIEANPGLYVASYPIPLSGGVFQHTAVMRSPPKYVAELLNPPNWPYTTENNAFNVDSVPYYGANPWTTYKFVRVDTTTNDLGFAMAASIAVNQYTGHSYKWSSNRFSAAILGDLGITLTRSQLWLIGWAPGLCWCGNCNELGG